MHKFQFVYDESYLCEGYERFNRFSGARKVLLFVICIMILVCLGFSWTSFSRSEPVPGVLFILLAAVMLLTRKYQTWMMKVNFRKSPYRDESLSITLSEEGFVSEGERQNVNLDWSVFTEARKLKDGFLLYQGPWMYNWLPYSALESGDEHELAELIRGNIANYSEHN